MFISFSIISHEQGDLVRRLLTDMRALQITDFEIILTLNLPERDDFLSELTDLPLRVVRNHTPKGFGANHNAAFALAQGRYFAIVNPDVRLPLSDPGALLASFADSNIGACAPTVLSPQGGEEDNARRFPTVLRLIRRVLGFWSVFGFRGKLDYCPNLSPVAVDWVAGIFVIFRREAFAEVQGFDERFFMYMEDADICRRLQHAGWLVLLVPGWSIVHDARRASHRSIKHLRWHLISAFRYLTGL
ncbi:glycosyltransferase [Candidatus Methylospira mobilis]|uniref:Glycosyltransferase n=1 Tax=Candidatus Methylospira mobilis TaxID=1808979 RepID=A0A5Q0BDD9_9GAMM|nr:glycosyltransferase [Candidatus Methylospira mobilis]QFY41820.1 glycosyltransferase [Candidatus Methylospira mobilis]WNV06687.1 glycosyltransferase [Candidatus Methylospira mobilis]